MNDQILADTDLTPLHFYDSVLGDCIEKVVSTKRDAVLYRRIPTPRPLPNIVLKEAWQVQRDEESQRRIGIEKSIAEQENPSKIDFRVQGVPHKAVFEDQE